MAVGGDILLVNGKRQCQQTVGIVPRLNGDTHFFQGPKQIDRRRPGSRQHRQVQPLACRRDGQRDAQQAQRPVAGAANQGLGRVGPTATDAPSALPSLPAISI